MSLVRLLAHYESSDSQHETLVPMDFARELAQTMRAEKISARLYRLLSPDSVFTPAKDFPQTHYDPDKPLKIGPGEVSGLRFRRPNPGHYAEVRRKEIVASIQGYQWA